MNITLKERLDLQRTAKIITESQYKKLLKENEESPEDIKAIAAKKFEEFKNSPAMKKTARLIMKDPKAMAGLKKFAQSIKGNSIKESDSTFVDSDFLNKAITKAMDVAEVSEDTNKSDFENKKSEFIKKRPGLASGINIEDEWPENVPYPEDKPKKSGSSIPYADDNAPVGAMAALGALLGVSAYSYFNFAAIMTAGIAAGPLLGAALAGAAACAVLQIIINIATG
jgi:hypothetical protein